MVKYRTNTVCPIYLALFGALAIPAIASAQQFQMLKELDLRGRAIAASPCRSPNSTRVKKQPNLHDPAVTDEILTIQCNGIIVETYQANYATPPARLPVLVRLIKSHPSLPMSIQIGASLESVIQTLGPPASTDNSTLTYPLSDLHPDQNTISFFHEAGRISSVSWAWVVD